MKEPKAIIENGIVVNADQLKRYWVERCYQDCIARRERFALRHSCEFPEIEDKPQVVEHIHRHSDMGKKEFDL